MTGNMRMTIGKPHDAEVADTVSVFILILGPERARPDQGPRPGCPAARARARRPSAARLQAGRRRHTRAIVGNSNSIAV